MMVLDKNTTMESKVGIANSLNERCDSLIATEFEETGMNFSVTNPFVLSRIRMRMRKITCMLAELDWKFEMF